MTKAKVNYVVLRVVTRKPVTRAEAVHLVKWQTSIDYETHYPDDEKRFGGTFRTRVTSRKAEGR